jgi:methylenetetrahydrofolate reductase (NADPH)
MQAAARPEGTAAQAKESLAGMLRRPRYEVFPLPGIEDELVQHVPKEVKVTVTSSPRRGLEVTLQLAEEVVRRGFAVVPHVAARLVADQKHLREIVDRLGRIGVHEVFVIAGDARVQKGKFAGAHDLLVALAEMEHDLAEIGISGYPESHPFISDETTIQTMFDKAPHSSYIVSQLCLDPGVITWWIGAVRERGVSLPIYVGIPGVAQRRKLLQISRRIGVGDSVRFLRKQGGVLTRLLLRGSIGPDYLLEGLSPEIAKIAGLHVYTFNELRRTEQWRRETLEHLGQTATDQLR